MVKIVPVKHIEVVSSLGPPAQAAAHPLGPLSAIRATDSSGVPALPLADHPCAAGDGSISKLTCVNYDPRTDPTTTAAATPAVTPAAAPAAPGQPATPTYTTAQAAHQAWTTQPLAAASVSIQPVGNTTLTGLPTYFHATFPGPGLAPGHTTTTTVLGHTITLRPTGVTYTYTFGDGTTLGPTPDPGGTYPTGTITHTYDRKSTVTTRVDTTVTGQYQENGGPWQTIPGTTTITGTPQQLTVAILQSRLGPSH